MQTAEQRCQAAKHLEVGKYFFCLQKAEKKLGFDKESSLFIDDTEDVLITAREYGIKYLLFKAHANSKTEPKKTDTFLTIHDFRELMPGKD